MYECACVTSTYLRTICAAHRSVFAAAAFGANTDESDGGAVDTEKSGDCAENGAHRSTQCVRILWSTATITGSVTVKVSPPSMQPETVNSESAEVDIGLLHASLTTALRTT